MTDPNDELAASNEEPYRLAAGNPEPRLQDEGGVPVQESEARRRLSGTPEEVRAIRQLLLPGKAEEEQRFSLAGLFALVTLASIVLAMGSYLPPAIFAGAAGAATLVGMFVLSLLRTPPLVVQLGWWLLLAIYLLAIGRAVWA